MEEHIKAIEGLIDANAKATPRTPFLEVALGALHTARDQVKTHIEELKRRADKAKAKG